MSTFFTHTRNRLASLGVAALLAPVLAVTTADASVIRHDRDPQLYLDLGASAAYQSVGKVSGATPDFGFSASGTLIASNWVLTAAHVVDNASSLSFQFGGTSYAASEWIAHSKWNGSLGGGYDIGLMRFDQDLAALTGLAPAALYSGSDELGRVGTAVGYGMTGTGTTGATNFDAQKRAGQNMIDSVLNTPGKKNRILLSDFDNPFELSDSSWGSGVPLDLESLIAPGDSGGGLFADIDGSEFLVGVHSFGWGLLDGDPNSDYGDASGHTRVSAFTGWIEDIINPSASEPKGKGGNGGGGGRPFSFGGTATGLVAVPEPGTLALFGLGLAGLGFARRRKAT